MLNIKSDICPGLKLNGNEFDSFVDIVVDC